MQNKRPGNELVYVRSLDPNDKRKTPRRVPRKLLGTAAAKNQRVVEVADPNAEPPVVKITPLPTVSTTADAGPSTLELLAKLQAENDALKSKLAGAEVPNPEPMTATPAPTFADVSAPTIPEPPKRGPGRPSKPKA